jgi:hypothetical protein
MLRSSSANYGQVAAIIFTAATLSVGAFSAVGGGAALSTGVAGWLPGFDGSVPVMVTL